jgi:transcriptional regulator with XRE-family HTH domain
MSETIDVFVGSKLKTKRIEKGISQDELGRLVGVTFQQIQKYEKGKNRIGASRLFMFAKILCADVNYFFEGISLLSGEVNLSEDKQEFDTGIEAKVIEREIPSLVKYYSAISDIKIRKMVLNLVKEMSKENVKIDSNLS